MKKTIMTAIILFLFVGYLFVACKQKAVKPEKAIAEILVTQVDSFTNIINGELLPAAMYNPIDTTRLKSLFLKARLTYKRFEWAAEYFDPATARFVNGAPVQEVEMTNGQIFEPGGLQLIETFLYPKYDVGKRQMLIDHLKKMQTRCGSFKKYFANIDLLDWQIFDAAKLQVFRVLTLGITGFDDPLTLHSMEESAASINSLQSVLAFYKSDKQQVSEKSVNAVKYLLQQKNFNSFNRAEFITEFGNPLSTAISDMEKAMGIHIIRYNRLLNQDAKTLFDTNAFNINAYIPDGTCTITPEKIALGKMLFTDVSLSGNGKRSCQSCHSPEKAFTDGLATNLNIDGMRDLPRNTPTLFNAAFQPAQFDDLRAKTLEDQCKAVIENPNEMHSSLSAVAKRLWIDTNYRKRFALAFPKANRSSIDTLEIMNAVASYVRSLSMLNSRFDDYMRGDKAAMNEQEIDGFNLFMGKAKCGTCHYMPLFNGTLPPGYVTIESEVIGTPKQPASKNIDPDMGRYAIMKINAFRHSFKISTLRNVAHTAPYMHNGAFATLEEVLDFYNKGGGAGNGIAIDNQTLSADKLNLTDQEQQDIIAFIKTLDNK